MPPKFLSSVKRRPAYMPPGIGLVTEKRLRLNFMAQRHSNLIPSSQVTLMTVNPVVAKPGLAEPLAVMTSAEGLALILFCSTAAVAIFVLMLPEMWQVVSTKITAFGRFHQTPCRSCRFLIDNHYLPCAVHPSVVFTEQALDCTDYHPLSHH